MNYSLSCIGAIKVIAIITFISLMHGSRKNNDHLYSLLTTTSLQRYRVRVCCIRFFHFGKTSFQIS